VPGDFILDWN